MTTVDSLAPASRKQIWLSGLLLLPLVLLALGAVPLLWAQAYLEDRARTVRVEASLVEAEPASSTCAYGFSVSDAPYRAEGPCTYLAQTHSPVPTLTVEYAPAEPSNAAFAGPSKAYDSLFLLVLPLLCLGLTAVLTWVRDFRSFPAASFDI